MASPSRGLKAHLAGVAVRPAALGTKEEIEGEARAPEEEEHPLTLKVAMLLELAIRGATSRGKRSADPRPRGAAREEASAGVDAPSRATVATS
mmetsp:Transcript_40115/g.113561  ORF Transcript_40115/g.113561 Transcript_40115/m.113561 type:complete len:93 (+) Transcript_40115:115-393(+)